MNIGIKGKDDSDVYSIIIATSEGIINLNKDRMQPPKLYKLLLLEQYDWDKVRSAIDKKLELIKPYDSIQSLNELTSNFYWEYEGMK